MNWKNMTLAHKISTIIAGLSAAVWLLAKAKPDLLPFDPIYPAIAVFTASEAVVYWKEKRVWSYILIAGAVICLACYILELAL